VTAALDRRHLLVLAASALAAPALAAPGAGERLAKAARAQVGVTTHYNGSYRKLAYPGGDPPRDTGVCADVIVRASRDGLGLDLQQLVHEDMARDFAAYPQAWKLKAPDANIDHRRVLNLEVFFRRAGAELWRAKGYTPGFAFPGKLQPGDILTWGLLGQGAHVGMVVEAGAHPRIVQNINSGAEEIPLLFMWPHGARARFRWPVA
jgi:uncharacterized protein YijF (DUF1287 family)